MSTTVQDAEDTRRRILQDMEGAYRVEADIKTKISIAKQILVLQKSLGLIGKEKPKESNLRNKYATNERTKEQEKKRIT